MLVAGIVFCGESHALPCKENGIAGLDKWETQLQKCVEH